ncbi:MAG: putative acyl-CoA dehydrogenase [Ilumatobacteraceae bacterium]|nr:putative acyl-CoA dehydrogenase [Ilumatobacteraceae bacterium]MCU1389734.1 putative acyl-CoA dehydrogenase [Ilumatobacteraceae bacterium]
MLDEIERQVVHLEAIEQCVTFAARLSAAVRDARRATSHLLGVSTIDRRRLHAASSPYLRLLGTTVCAGLLAKAAVSAATRDDDFHRAKIASACFFGEQILPTVSGLMPAIEATAESLYAIDLRRLS